MRQASIERNTKETKIALTLNLDGTGKAQIDTGVGFLNHMLELLSFHGQFDLIVSCKGDTQVDDHHSVEDIGITLGQAFAQALGDKKGIVRYGNFLLPMDEALVLCAVDLCGRDTLGYQVNIPTQKVGAFDTELVQEFMLGFTRNAQACVHFVQMNAIPTNISSIGKASEKIPIANSGNNSYRITVVANNPGSATLPQAEYTNMPPNPTRQRRSSQSNASTLFILFLHHDRRATEPIHPLFLIDAQIVDDTEQDGKGHDSRHYPPVKML